MTILFRDGFESGDFSKWTSVPPEVEIVTSPTHHSNYSCRANPWAFLSKAFPTYYSELYLRTYIRIASTPMETAYTQISGIFNGQSTEAIVKTIGGIIRFGMRIGGGAPDTIEEYVMDFEVQLNTWYSVEIKSKDLDQKLWINGELKMSQTYDFASPLGANKIAVAWDSFTQPSGYCFHDCVIAADSYIGLLCPMSFFETINFLSSFLARQTKALQEILSFLFLPIFYERKALQETLDFLPRIIFDWTRLGTRAIIYLARKLRTSIKLRRRNQ